MLSNSILHPFLTALLLLIPVCLVVVKFLNAMCTTLVAERDNGSF